MAKSDVVESVAKSLYNKFWEFSGWRTLKGSRALEWEDSKLPEEVKDRWRAVAKHVRTYSDYEVSLKKE